MVMTKAISGNITNLGKSFFLSILVLLASCVNNIPDDNSDNESEEDSDNIPVSIIAKVDKAFTRMTGSGFEAGDRVGLYATVSTNPLSGKRYIDNLQMEYQSDETLLSPKPIYYPTGDATLNLFSYYPYQIGGIPAGTSLLPVKVQTDQSSDEAFENSNFLAAQIKNVSAEDGTLTLNYHHQFSKIVVALKPCEGLTLDEVLEFKPRMAAINFMTEGEYDFEKDSIVNLTGTHDIVAHGEWKKSEANGLLVGKEVIVLPQDVGYLERKISFEMDDRIYTSPIEEQTLKAGDVLELTIAITPTSCGLINASGIVTAWNEARTSESEATENSAAVHTSVFSFAKTNGYRVTYQGELVAELWREYLRNGTEEVQALVAYPVKDGKNCDLQNGLLLQFYGSTASNCGGKLSWEADGSGYTYTEDTYPPIETFYVTSDYDLCLEDNGNTLNVNVGRYTLIDYRDEKQTEYPITKIGTQFWMAGNLTATSYANGTKLKQIKALGEDQIGYYKVESKEVYFYNGETLLNGEMAPDGWRIPTTADWAQMKTYIGNDVSVLKAGTWKQMVDKDKEVTPAVDLTWFHAYPVGMWTGAHSSKEQLVAYWSWDTTNNVPAEEFITFFGEENTFVEGVSSDYSSEGHYKGGSIRCIKE